MKKISHLCMLLLLLCTTFFVLNVNVTREIVRIQEMGKTTYSFDLYLKDVTKPTETILQFFEEVASQDKVSIIKVDNGDEAVKAGVFDKETFPYQEFGLTSLDFSKNEKGVYSNQDLPNNLGTIPTFLKVKLIRLQTFQSYIEDKSHTVNGLSLIHISEPTRRLRGSRMPSSA